MTFDIAKVREKYCERILDAWYEDVSPLLTHMERVQAENERLRDAAKHAIPILHDHGLYRAENKLREAIGWEVVPT